MFVQAQIDLRTTPFPVARQRLTAYALDRPTLLRDCQTALHIAAPTVIGDGSPLTPVQVLTAPARHYPEVTTVPVRWLRPTAPAGEKPLLDANLEVIHTGGSVRLTAVASYRPPSPSPDPDAAQPAADILLRTLLRRIAAVIETVPTGDDIAAPPSASAAFTARSHSCR